jgi:signal transduction histidine kinase
MKSTRISFLFYFIVFLQLSFGQELTDSLAFYQDVALKPQKPADLENAYTFFYQEFEKAFADKKMPIAINHLYYMASINHKKGNYNLSEETAVKALKLLDIHRDVNNNIRIKKSFYNLLGMLYYEQRNKDKSLELYNKVLEISDNTRDSAIVYNNISNIYKRYDDIEKAKDVLNIAYELTPRIGDTLTIALISDNLGFVYSMLDNRNEDYKLMNKALQLRTLVKDTSSLYTSYANFARYYYNVDSLNQSKEHALKALQLADSINSVIYRHDALGLLTRVSEDKYARAYKSINDSINNAKKEKAGQFALMKYDYSEFKRKALESQLEEERQKTRAIIGFAIAIGIALLSVFLYVFLRARHKKEKLKQVFDTESRISKQIHDEVANDVYQVMTKLENQDHKRESLIDELHKLYYRTRDISKEHSVIDNHYPFKDYLSELIQSFNDSTTNVIVKGISEIQWQNITEINRITIYKVLQELLINMKKYSEASLVVIVFKKEGKNISINYSDNGIGTKLVKRTGLQNTENRIASINGTITFETEPDKGFKVKISV